jgi:hypothetical protein
VEQVREIRVTRIHLVPQASEAPCPQIARDENRLAGACRSANPRNTVPPQSVELFEETLTRIDAGESWRREFRRVDRGLRPTFADGLACGLSGACRGEGAARRS